MAITLKELARELGLSQSTVSKALNDRYDVGLEVRGKVLEAASRLGYVANPIARKLVSGVDRTIGVFLLNRTGLSLRDFFGFQYLEGILQEAQTRGFDLHLFSPSSEKDYRQSYIDLLKRKGLPGAVFIGLYLDDPFIADIKASPLPLAVLDTMIKGDRLGFVTTDNRLGMQRMLEYLWGLGHRRFGFIGFTARSHSGNTRRRTYQAFLEARQAFDPRSIALDSLTVEGGAAAARVLLSLVPRPTVLVAATDLQAIGALRAARDLGLRVPTDVSVTGFDDIQASAHTFPALTTVAQDTQALGRAAAGWLLDTIEGTPAPSRLMVAPQLALRESAE